MPNDSLPRLTAFVGRSFLPEDESVWTEIRTVLDALRPLGFHFEDASQAQLRPISEKVRTGIDRNDVYVGILTRRRPIGEPYSPFRALQQAFMKTRTEPAWTTSHWIVQESGYAIGKDKKVVFLVESGVDLPRSDLHADGESR